ncbi:MAG: T9SS type A sorting domain-containing protein, partial [Saprospiraceae bacterium]
QYILRLEDANSPYCQSLGVYDPSANLGDLLVVPNPAADQVNINFNMDQPGPIRCKIISSSGSIVQEAISMATGGKNQITSDVSTLPIGIYYVQIIRKDGVQHASFQVRK